MVDNTDREIPINEISFRNYLIDEYSICREERQYALLLNNILKARAVNNNFGGVKVDKIIEICGLKGIKIENVFYEATFMRDYFKKDKNENTDEDMRFNKKLADFAKIKLGIDIAFDDIQNSVEGYIDRNLGGKVQIKNAGICDASLIFEIFQYMKCMMNSKPDIVVVGSLLSEKNEIAEKVVIFIECKFESAEDRYCTKKNFSKEIKEKYCRKQSELCRSEREKINTEQEKSDYCKNDCDKIRKICKRCDTCIWTQTNIQNSIGEFICDYVNNSKRNNGIKYSKIQSQLVKFTRNPADDEILIKDLIDIEDEIWKGNSKKLWQNGLL